MGATQTGKLKAILAVTVALEGTNTQFLAEQKAGPGHG